MLSFTTPLWIQRKQLIVDKVSQDKDVRLSQVELNDRGNFVYDWLKATCDKIESYIPRFNEKSKKKE